MTITDNVKNEIIINKSKFITYLYKINSKDEINIILNNLKNKYKDATHICYAYILDNYIKYDDDNEPSGTAGFPILEVLKKNNLNHIICLVIRYFGGIKLGSNGLIRAYSSSCSSALKLTNIVKLEKKFKIKINMTYSSKKLVDIIINEKNILDKIFNEQVIYYILITKEEKEKIDSLGIPYEIIEENYF